MPDEPSISASYGDGWTAASRPVALTLNEAELAIATPDGAGIDRWPLAGVHSIDPWPVYVDNGPNATLYANLMFRRAKTHVTFDAVAERVQTLTTENLGTESMMVLRAGKKKYHIVCVA